MNDDNVDGRPATPANELAERGQRLLQEARRNVGEAWRLIEEMRLVLSKSDR